MYLTDPRPTDWILTCPPADVRPVDRATLEPILFHLESPDIEVQRAASAALGNLAVDGTRHVLSILSSDLTNAW